jgi:predicted RNA-binding protein with PUA-like domain
MKKTSDMAAGSAIWLVKSEPSVYSFDELVKDGRTVWDGVRNPEARANLRAMKLGDRVLYYHSNEGKEIVGMAEVVREAYPDPKDEAWSAVDLAPTKRFARPVTLSQVKADERFAAMGLVRRSRLSVSSVTAAELQAVLSLTGKATAIER